jgi:hypothetical protein
MMGLDLSLILIWLPQRNYIHINRPNAYNSFLQANLLLYDLETAKFIDFGTRALFVSANLYNPGFNRFIEIRLVKPFKCLILIVKGL